MSNWPDPARPGVPLNPERDGWHWLSAMYYDDPIGPPVACFWEAKLERWPRLQDKPGNYPVSRGFCYLSPAATPEEIAAKDARIAELEAKLVAAVDIVSTRAAARHKEASLCGSDRSKKHMQIRADEAGQIVALLRATLTGGKDE